MSETALRQCIYCNCQATRDKFKHVADGGLGRWGICLECFTREVNVLASSSFTRSDLSPDDRAKLPQGLQLLFIEDIHAMVEDVLADKASYCGMEHGTPRHPNANQQRHNGDGTGLMLCERCIRAVLVQLCECHLFLNQGRFNRLPYAMQDLAETLRGRFEQWYNHEQDEYELTILQEHYPDHLAKARNDLGRFGAYQLRMEHPNGWVVRRAKHYVRLEQERRARERTELDEKKSKATMYRRALEKLDKEIADADRKVAK